MISIPVAIPRISVYKFKRHYLKKKKLFSIFFIAFPKCSWNVEHFETKDEYNTLKITKVIEPDRCSYLNV